MYCSNCHKQNATIHILSLEDGKFLGEQRLCPTCAEAAGHIHGKAPIPLTLIPEFDDLMGGTEGESSGGPELSDPTDSCPACGMTTHQFRSRGRLGCPRCYEMFRDSLLPLLERVHDGTTHRGRCPGKPVAPTSDDEQLHDLRSSLRDAINAENYELAARLRDEIRKVSPTDEEAAN